MKINYLGKSYKEIKIDIFISKVQFCILKLMVFDGIKENKMKLNIVPLKFCNYDKVTVDTNTIIMYNLIR